MADDRRASAVQRVLFRHARVGSTNDILYYAGGIGCKADLVWLLLHASTVSVAWRRHVLSLLGTRSRKLGRPMEIELAVPIDGLLYTAHARLKLATDTPTFERALQREKIDRLKAFANAYQAYRVSSATPREAMRDATRTTSTLPSTVEAEQTARLALMRLLERAVSRLQRGAVVVDS